MKIEDARTAYLENPTQLLIDSTPELKTIVDFIAKYALRGVIGLSGGVDSALVAALAVKALGKENVFGLMMPAGNSAIDLEYAKRCAEQLGIKYEVIDLQPIVKVCEANTHDLFCSKIDAGNLKARLRMIHLYAAARRHKGIVLGTGNKSEDMIGYFTKYGDGGVDILPIAQLYKTQVWKLAKKVGVPDCIVKRIPTAGLWPGQTDEGELGIKYADLDKILLGYELGFGVDEIAQINHIDASIVQNIFRKIADNAHKLAMPSSTKPKFEGGGK
jgi:NAD+ synthase